MRYSASFNVLDTRHGLGSVTFSAAGEADFTIDLTSLHSTVLGGGREVTVFNHYAMDTFVGESLSTITGPALNIASDSLAAAMRQRMIDDSGWADAADLWCAFIGGRYVFSYLSGTGLTAVAFSNAAARTLFGFVEDFSGAAETVTGTGVPNFLIEPVLTAITTEDTAGYIYEPAGIATAAMSSGGVPFGLPRTAAPTYRDWTQQAETRAKTLRLSATDTHPFTHQMLFETCRSAHPFAVVDGFDDGNDYLFKLRPEGCMWSSQNCRRMGGEMDDANFHVSYRAQQLGSFTGEDDEPDVPVSVDLPTGWYLFRGTSGPAPDGFPEDAFVAATIIHGGVDPASPLAFGLCRIEADVVDGELWLSLQPSNATNGSYPKGYVWFYGYQTTLLSGQNFSATLQVPTPAVVATQRGELRLAVYSGGPYAGAPAPHSTYNRSALIGWRSGSGIRRCDYSWGSIPGVIGTPGMNGNVLLSKQPDNHWVGYANGYMLGEADMGGGYSGLSTGASVWVGFQFTADLAVEGGPAVLRANLG